MWHHVMWHQFLMPCFDIIYYFAVCGTIFLWAPVLCGTMFYGHEFMWLLFCDYFNDVL